MNESLRKLQQPGLLALLLMALAGPAHAQLYSDKVIGSLGGGYTTGAAINGTGQATGQSRTAAGHLHAFLWNGNAFVDLGTLGGGDSNGTALNASGQVTGSSYLAGDQASHAMLWNGKKMVDLGTLGGTNSEGTAINAAGQVTGWSQVGGDKATHAFLWNGTRMVDLGTLGGASSAGVAINASGQVTGTSDTVGNAASHAFLWNGRSMQDLGTIAGAVTMAPVAINSAGQIAGTATGSGTPGVRTGFFWDGTRLSALTVPGATASAATAMNAKGQVTGWAITAKDPRGSAYLWDGAAVTQLDTNNGSDTSIRKCNAGNDINSAGVVLGQLCSYGGVADPFLWNGFKVVDLNEIVVLASIGFYDTVGLINARGQILIQDYDGGLDILSPIPGAIALDLPLQNYTTPGCQDITGYVSASTPAPAGGLVVSLSDTLAAASMPATVTIPAGKIGATFTITTKPVNREQSGVVTATLGARQATRDLTIRPMGVAAVAVLPNPVKGGNPVTGTLTLECKAPASLSVALGSNNVAVARPVPATVTIPKGQDSSSFQITTNHVLSRVKVVISATANGVGKSANLNVNR